MVSLKGFTKVYNPPQSPFRKGGIYLKLNGEIAQKTNHDLEAR